MAVQGCAFVTSLHCPVFPTLENYVNAHPTLTAVKIQVILEMYVCFEIEKWQGLKFSSVSLTEAL